MSIKKSTKFGRLKKVFVGFLLLFGFITTTLAPTTLNTTEVYAEPVIETVTDSEAEAGNTQSGTDTCKESLGALGWLVCPTTGKIAEAVDWLYGKIEGILVINPISMKDGSPVYEIWKYCLGITNVLFIIFLLVVIYSQLTGLGLSNYGLKKALPKLIVMAIMVNLSFLICSLAVDVSNVVGNGLRGVFATVGTSAANASGAAMAGNTVPMAEMYAAMAGGVGVGAALIAFDPGMIWLLIPAVLGAIVAVVTGLITIALRQAVVVLLIMVAPLAFVANILPNTESWFKKWKDLMKKMLIFYPMFSLLFGASSLAGYAIIASAKDGFGLILGVAVQIFPLFYSWKLMQMSDTFLGKINAGLRGWSSKSLATNRAWAESHRQLARARFLERNRMPSAWLMNFSAGRKAAREDEMNSINEHLKAKYSAKSDAKDYTSDGRLSKRGQRKYNRQALTMRYSQFSQMHKDNLEEGFGEHNPEYRKTIAEMRNDVLNSRGNYSSVIRGRTYEERIRALDTANVNASDDLKAEIARGAEIEYRNAKGYYERVLNAKYADDDNKALLAGNEKHQMHPGILDNPENLARYERWKAVMEGNSDGVQTIFADAASSMNAQAQIRRNKFQAAADLTPATQNVADHISELIGNGDAANNIDAIVGSLRILNKRGDTDMVAKELEHNLVGILSDNGKIEVGTYASQTLANYLMFDVKDNDPLLRRFGKYINMQTAAIYNDNDPAKRRIRKDVSWWEYVNGEYVEHDENGQVIFDNEGNVVTKKTRGMRELMKGTSYSKVERTAFRSQTEGVRAASYDIGPDGRLLPGLNVNRYLNNLDVLWDSIMPNVISDQFGYLSGSEQAFAFAKDLTGIGKDGKFDWPYIFGDKYNPTLEDKAKYIEKARDRVKKLLSGHVPSQIARSKSDVLQAIQSQFALFDEIMYIDPDDKKEKVDLTRLEALERRKFDEPGSHERFLAEKQDAIKKRFQESFKENALKGFAKQFRKGYQGEAKELLIKMLDPDALYDRFFPHGEGRRDSRHNDEEDDGMPVRGDLGDGLSGRDIYNDTRETIREIFERHRGTERFDVEEFWDEVRNVIESSVEMGDLRAVLDHFAEGVPQYTDVSQLYFDIMQTFFDNRS